MFVKILLGLVAFSCLSSCFHKESKENPSPLPPQQQNVVTGNTTTGNPSILPPSNEVKPVNID